MPKYVIERTLAGAGKLSPSDLQGIAAKSNATLHELGPDVQWVQSYVTADKIFCVYHAKDAELVREHARRAGFPCDEVHEVAAMLDPASGEAR